MSLWSGCVVVLVVSCFALAAPVPANDAKAAVQLYFRNLERGLGDTEPLFAPPAKDVIAELVKYLDTGTDNQKFDALRMIGTIGRMSKDKDARALAVKTLLGYATADGKPHVREGLTRLLEFTKADFPPTAAADIEKLVRVEDPRDEAFLLAGLVEVRSLIDDLKERTKVKLGATPFSDGTWEAHLSLARLGDRDSTKYCIQVLEGEKDIVQRVRHFPELLFTRQDAAVKYLTQYLMSEERLPSPRGGGELGSKAAQYALNAFAEGVEGFPVKSERGPSYTEDQLATARKWMKDQKDLKFKR